MRIRAQTQRGSFHLLIPDQPLGGKIDKIRIDGEIHGVSRNFLGDRQADHYIGHQRAAAGCRVELQIAGIAQRLHADKLRRRFHRPLGAETQACGRRLGERVRHFEQRVGHRELAPCGKLGDAAADLDLDVASHHAERKIGVADGRQRLDRPNRDTARDDDRPSSGTGGPDALRVGIGAFTATTTRSTVPLCM